MENKKIFIGNLDFEVTEGEVRTLLSKYGTVVNIKMHQKKGYAFAEMGDSAEAAKAVQKLDGVKYRDREMRVSIEMKPGKAKSLSVKRYKEKGESFSRGTSVDNKETRSRSEKSRDNYKQKPGRAERTSGPSRGSAGNSYGSKENQQEYGDRPAPAKRRMPSPERDRWATERPADYTRPEKKERNNKRPSRDGEIENYNRPERNGQDGRTGERSSAPAKRPLRDYTKESSRGPNQQRREPGSGRPSYPGRHSRNDERSSSQRSDEIDRNSERTSNSGRASRNSEETSYKPQRKEWNPEKPAYSGRNSRDGERPSLPRPQKKEWSQGKPTGKTNDSWRERPEKKEFSGDKPRDYSKPRPVSGSHNRISKTSKPRSVGSDRKSPSGSSRPKSRSGSGDRDRNSRQKRD